MEYAFLHDPICLALVRKYPGYIGYQYEGVGKLVNELLANESEEDRIAIAMATFEYRLPGSKTRDFVRVAFKREYTVEVLYRRNPQLYLFALVTQLVRVPNF